MGLFGRLFGKKQQPPAAPSAPPPATTRPPSAPRPVEAARSVEPPPQVEPARPPTAPTIIEELEETSEIPAEMPIGELEEAEVPVEELDEVDELTEPPIAELEETAAEVEELRKETSHPITELPAEVGRLEAVSPALKPPESEEVQMPVSAAAEPSLAGQPVEAQREEVHDPGETRLSLQVLFPKAPILDPNVFHTSLRMLHSSMAEAYFKAKNVDGVGEAQAIWGPHRITLMIRTHPLPPEVAKRCIEPAHYRPEQKKQARDHQAYVVLYHEGGGVDPWEQYAALAATAAALMRQGATTITNAYAFTSAPAKIFDQVFGARDAWDMLLNKIPPLMLYCGFIKYVIPGEGGVWMRTHGAHLVGLPDLALRAADHKQGNEVFALLNAIITQLRQTKIPLADGQTLKLAPNVSVRVRLPRPEERVLQSPGGMFAIEPDPVGSQTANVSL